MDVLYSSKVPFRAELGIPGLRWDRRSVSWRSEGQLMCHLR